MPSLINLAGRVFGRLTVTSRAPNADGRVCWNCICECGTAITTKSTYLTFGDTNSCGCLQRDVVSTLNTKGRITAHPYYTVWSGMKDRCSNVNRADSKYYAAKGVKVCRSWLESFDNFAADMGPRPVDAHGRDFELDRIDPDGDYAPDNCRWVSKQVNRSRAVEKRDADKADVKLNRALWSLADGMAQLKQAA